MVSTLSSSPRISTDLYPAYIFAEITQNMNTLLVSEEYPGKEFAEKKLKMQNDARLIRSQLFSVSGHF